jgi:hypothetical protein
MHGYEMDSQWCKPQVEGRGVRKSGEIHARGDRRASQKKSKDLIKISAVPSPNPHQLTLFFCLFQIYLFKNNVFIYFRASYYLAGHVPQYIFRNVTTYI